MMQFCYEPSPIVPLRYQGMPVDFVCSIGNLAYVTMDLIEPDNRKTEHYLYDMARQEWRDDLVPFNSPYGGLSVAALERAAQALEAEHAARV